MIRLELLAEHGGVWADATMLCLRPLDSWIAHALPEGDGEHSLCILVKVLLSCGCTGVA